MAFDFSNESCGETTRFNYKAAKNSPDGVGEETIEAEGATKAGPGG
jgi:hypothetical protein